MIALLVTIVAIAAYFSKSYWMPAVVPSEEGMMDTWLVETWIVEVVTKIDLTVTTGNVENSGSLEQNDKYLVIKTEKYVVKWRPDTDVEMWEILDIYDSKWTVVFSIPTYMEWVLDIVGDYIIIEGWSGPDIRLFSIYNIKTKKKVFSSNYDAQNRLRVEWNNIYFATPVYDWNIDKREINEPTDVPTCPTGPGRDSRPLDLMSYSELRVFNVETSELEKTGNLICTRIQ